MKLWEQYLMEQSPVVGYMNYMEDRMKIMTLSKQSMNKCLIKFRKIPNAMKRHLATYQCEIPVLEETIQRIRSASEKCENTKFPEKCSEFYNQLIPKLEYKIKFNKSQNDTLRRKLGIADYD